MNDTDDGDANDGDECDDDDTVHNWLRKFIEYTNINEYSLSFCCFSFFLSFVQY